MAAPRGLLALLIILAGCGGPSEEREQAPVAPSRSAPARDTRPVIAAFGDSLTEGFGVDSGRSYPDVLQRLLDQRGYRYRVVNLGVSGETSSNGLARLSGVLDLKPALVVLEFGGNDGLRGVPVDLTRANLDSMIGTLKSAGIKVVLAGMTLPPNYGPDYIRRFERIYSELAAKHGVPLIPFFLEGVGGNTRLMQRDGLHPNAAGYARVAEIVMTAVDPILSRK